MSEAEKALLWFEELVRKVPRPHQSLDIDDPIITEATDKAEIIRAALRDPRRAVVEEAKRRIVTLAGSRKTEDDVCGTTPITWLMDKEVLAALDAMLEDTK